MSLADMAIHQLTPLTPTAAARWLLTMANSPETRAMVASLCEHPDEDIVPTLAQLREARPEFGPLVEWLYGRPEWTVLVVHALREITGVGILTPAAEAAPEGAWFGI